jgi:UPF0716 protein FxsA
LRLLSLLLLTFILIPLAELSLLLLLGSYTHWYVPLLLVIVTGVCGAALARLQGWQTYRRIQQELAEGRMPTDSLLDAAMIFVAGALLLTPGMLTDALGFSLLLPPCRRLYKHGLVRWIKSRFRVQTFTTTAQPSAAGRDEIIDSYVIDSRSDDGEPGPSGP